MFSAMDILIGVGFGGRGRCSLIHQDFGNPMMCVQLVLYLLWREEQYRFAVLAVVLGMALWNFWLEGGIAV